MNTSNQPHQPTLGGQWQILRTKLQPPRLRRWVLPRERLMARLDKVSDCRLTLLIAPTGYGKSTLLGNWLLQISHPYAWYNVGPSDSDPFLFLLHLIYAFREQQPDLGKLTLQMLETEWSELRARPEERRVLIRQTLHLFVNELCEQVCKDIFLIFDDFHLLETHPEVLKLAQELLLALPPQLHVIISTRQRPDFEWLARWQAQQELMVIGKEALAFTSVETAQLFEEAYGYKLTPQQAERLVTETEGWIIALQMVWQNLQSGETNLSLDNMLENLTHNLTGLFDYLAQEVLNRQEASLQRFLLDSAVLRRMSGPVCDFVLQLPEGEAEKILRHLSEVGLFIIVQGDDPARTYRYHHLFSEFLYARLQTNLAYACQLHQRAALYYEQQTQIEEALHHWVATQSWVNASRLLATNMGQRWIETGQMARVERYLANFPPNFLTADPALLLLRGDCLRLTSRFEEALQCYRLANSSYETQSDQLGLARALRGQALVYLDTVQPAAAEEWLERALEISQTTSDRQLRANLLRDLAENKLNRGRPLEAAELHRQARSLLGEGEDETQDDVRILLRSGRINQAVELLERTVEEAGAGRVQRPGRSHREGLLVLSLLNATRGEGVQAEARATRGITLARELHTPFTEAVAWHRLGHALTVEGQFEQAWQAYQQGLELGRQLKVRRLRAEGLMGLTLLLGSPGKRDLTETREAAAEGLQVARRSGDEWIEGFLTISLAAALVEHSENKEAVAVAQTAYNLLGRCGDHFGQTVARLWQVLANNDKTGLQEVRLECTRTGYNFLLERPTLFGPKNPALLERLANLNKSAQITRTTPKVFSPSFHPSGINTQLQVITLGSFAVRRHDGSELDSHDWQRDKARQLFQLLVTYRNQPLSKDRLLDYLWPDSPSGVVDASFKVALNALLRALEPTRSSRTQSNYVERIGSGPSLAYKLRLDFWLDTVEFEKLVELGHKAELVPQTEPEAATTALDYYTEALQLYRGDFLPTCLYEDWAAPERERLLNLFLTTAERVAHLQAKGSQWGQCAATCRLILSRDDCWEEAYRLLMLALWKQRNRAAALRTYEKCLKILADELGITPMPQTVALYDQILRT